MEIMHYGYMDGINSILNGTQTNWSAVTGSDISFQLAAASQNIWVSIVTWFSVLSFFASLSLNLLLMIVYIQHPHLRTAFNVYIFNLSCTEVLIALTAMPMNFVANIYGYWPGGVFLCGVLQYSNLVVGAGLRYGHLLISFNRLWAVRSPITYKNQHTYTVSSGIVIVVWICLHFLQLPVVIKGRLTVKPDDPRCILNTNSQYEMALAAHIIGFLLPEAFVVLTYPYILYKIHKRYLLKRNRISHFLLNGGGIIRNAQIRKTSSIASDLPSSVANGPGTPTPEIFLESPGTGRSGSSQFMRSPVPQPATAAYVSGRTRNHDRVMLYLVVAIIICWTPNHVFFTMQRLYNYWDPVYFGMQYCIFYANSWINPIICYLTLHKMRSAVNDLFKCNSK